MNFLKMILLFIVVLLPALACGDQGGEQAAKRTLQHFCTEMNEGRLQVWEKSEKIVKFSPQREKLEKQRDSEFHGRVLSLLGDSLNVVTSYSLKELTVTGQRATALIVYERIAKTKGEGGLDRIILPDKAKEEVVVQMVYEANQWWILDPPLPHVSLSALISTYEYELKQIDKIRNNPKISSAQKRQFAQYENELKTLKILEKRVQQGGGTQSAR